MRARNPLLMLLATAVMASGCSTHLGRTTPVCDENVISTAVILSAQSVRGTAYVPCINNLQPGWEYEHLVARSGQSRFWLNSDRVGDHFLEVTLASSCDITGAAERNSDEAPIPLYIDEITIDYRVNVTIVPEGEGGDQGDYAAEIAQEIGATRVGNRLVQVTLDSSDLPTAERIRLALDKGRAVMVVGPREHEDGTVELHIQHGGETVAEVTPGMRPTDAVEEIAEPLGDPVYRATWYYPFESGCVTYRFDAKGAGSEQIAREVMTALGLLDLAPIREYGEQFGYIIP